jgi:hypothetical protein
LRRSRLAPALFALSLSSTAYAQLHWDASVHGGASERILSSVGNAPAGTALPGPELGVQAHVALIPFVRVGLYGSFEMSSVDGTRAPARNFWAVGAQGKIVSPWPRGSLRLFATLGFGYVGVYAPSYARSVIRSGTPIDVMVDGSGGGFAEIPFGIGVSYKLRGPLTVYAQLLTRFGLGFWGTLYGEGGGRNARNPVAGRVAIAPDGYDILSLGLVVGVGLDL